MAKLVGVGAGPDSFNVSCNCCPAMGRTSMACKVLLAAARAGDRRVEPTMSTVRSAARALWVRFNGLRRIIFEDSLQPFG